MLRARVAAGRRGHATRNSPTPRLSTPARRQRAVNFSLSRRLHGSQEVWRQWKEIRKPILTCREAPESRRSCLQGSAGTPDPYPWSRRFRSRLSPRGRAGSRFSCRPNLLRVRWALVIGQAVFELPWDAFVERDFHPSWPTTTDPASSNAAIAASLVTVGKSSMNALRVCPPSR